MPFSDLVKLSALTRAGNRCECVRLRHTHAGRCTTRVSRLTAHFHHRTAQIVGGNDTLSNCEVVCVTCHRETASYGRH
jgi:hypothetical protein